MDSEDRLQMLNSFICSIWGLGDIFKTYFAFTGLGSKFVLYLLNELKFFIFLYDLG